MGFIPSILLIAIAALCEIFWATSLKLSNGLSNLTPAMIAIPAMILSGLLIGLASKSLPIGTAYAIWTALGTVGIVVVGAVFFNEPLGLYRISCLALILLGVSGLRFLA